MKVLSLRVLAWIDSARLPQRIDFIKNNLSKHVNYSEIHVKPVKSLGYYLGYVLGFTRAVPLLLKQKYDILLLENAYLMPFGIISRLAGKKVIAEYVDYYPNMLRRIYRTRRLRYYVSLLLCSIFSKIANSIIVETNLSKEIIISLGVKSSKISVIPQSPDMEIIKRVDSSETRQELGIGKQEFVIGYLGKFPDHYGLEMIPPAVAIAESSTSRNLVLLMVGDGDFLPVIQNLTKKLGLKRVIFTGKVPFGDVSRYYSMFDVLLYTPDTASGIKLAESMLTGTPVIIGPGHADVIITDGVNGFVAKQRTPESFAEKIIELEKMDSSAVSMLSKRIRESGNKMFGQSINEYLQLFNALTDTKSP
ncbi:MAG: glycosyltransferase [Candidatus Hodarchaeales archaeon]